MTRYPVPDAVAVEPRLLSRSWRKVCKSVPVDVLLVELVLLVLLDELPPEAFLSAETRLLKSDSSVLRVLFVEEDEDVEDVDELPELSPSSEINCSSLLVKFEYAEAAVEVVEEDESLLEPEDSEFMAENRSCINFPKACRGSVVEPVESVDDEAELVDEVEPSEEEFAPESGGGPLGGAGMEIPI